MWTIDQVRELRLRVIAAADAVEALPEGVRQFVLERFAERYEATLLAHKGRADDDAEFFLIALTVELHVRSAGPAPARPAQREFFAGGPPL